MRRLACSLAPVLLAVASAGASSGDDPAPNPPLVEVRVWWFDVPPERAECWRDPCSPRWRAFTAEEGEAFLKEIAGAGFFVSSASTTVAAGAPARCEVIRKISYVANYTREVPPGLTWDPVVKQVPVGTALAVVPYGGERVDGLDVKESSQSLVCLRDEIVQAGESSKDLRLQFPETAGRSWSARIPATDGGYLLLFGPDGFRGEKGTARLALISARSVPLPK